MSENIPFEIQMEIILRIPDTKSVIRCRSVSKAWKFAIDGKDFVTAHTLRRTHHDLQANHHLLMRYNRRDPQVKYVSIVDDGTFPHQQLSVCVPDSVHKFTHNPKILGSSHGLFCLYERQTSTAIIWNPSIRKTVATKVPNVSRERAVVGFGVCPSILDPKLVKVTYVPDNLSRSGYVHASTRVEVFTLSSGGAWRSPLSSNVPHKSIVFGDYQAVVDGFIYWNAFHNVRGGGFRDPKLIMSFDLTSEEITKVNLPDHLALNPYAHLSLSNLKESLAVLNFHQTPETICDVWMMIGHGTRSFNKLYSINVVTTPGFRKSGTPIIQVNDHKFEVELAIYEREPKSITNIGIRGIHVPNVLCEQKYQTVVGFGICPSILDAKLVKIAFVHDFSRLQDVNASTQVEVNYVKFRKDLEKSIKLQCSS